MRNQIHVPCEAPHLSARCRGRAVQIAQRRRRGAARARDGRAAEAEHAVVAVLAQQAAPARGPLALLTASPRIAMAAPHSGPCSEPLRASLVRMVCRVSLHAQGLPFLYEWLYSLRSPAPSFEDCRKIAEGDAVKKWWTSTLASGVLNDYVAPEVRQCAPVTSRPDAFHPRAVSQWCAVPAPEHRSHPRDLLLLRARALAARRCYA